MVILRDEFVLILSSHRETCQAVLVCFGSMGRFCSIALTSHWVSARWRGPMAFVWATRRSSLWRTSLRRTDTAWVLVLRMSSSAFLHGQQQPSC